MSEANIMVFVYGTLLSGFGNHALISDPKTSVFKGQDTITGDMYGHGIPFVNVHGKGTVHGELYLVTPETLRRLDRLEGYNERHPHLSGGYVRVKVTTHRGVDTFVYAMNRTSEEDLKRWKPSIPSGDFRQHREEIGRPGRSCEYL